GIGEVQVSRAHRGGRGISAHARRQGRQAWPARSHREEVGMRSAERGMRENIMFSTEQVIGTTPVVIRRRVKWGDCDPAGVVYTVTFGEYVIPRLSSSMACSSMAYHNASRTSTVSARRPARSA